MAEPQRPYVRYKIEADVPEKGVGFAVKKVIKSFLFNHGYQATLAVESSSSDNFVGILSVFDSGKYDFNMAALMEQIGTSGRMPSNTGRPPKITMTPLPVDATYQIEDGSGKDDLAWQKTVEQLHAQLGEKDDLLEKKDDELGELTHSLGERQKALDDQKRRSSDLEKKLRSTKPAVFDSPLAAVLEGYMKGSIDWLMEATDDLVRLPGRDVSALAYLDGSELGTEKIRYISHRIGIGFRTEEELDKWAKDVAKYSNWEETPAAIELMGKKKQQDINFEAIKKAEELGASKEILEVMKKALDENKIEGLEDILVKNRENFARGKDICAGLEGIRRDYEQFVVVQKSVAARRAAGREFPIVVHCQGIGETNDKLLTSVYMPSVDLESPIEKKFLEDLKSPIPSEDFDIIAQRYSEEIAELRIIPKADAVAKKKRDISDATGLVLNYLPDATRTYKILGLKTRIIIHGEPSERKSVDKDFQPKPQESGERDDKTETPQAPAPAQ